MNNAHLFRVVVLPVQYQYDSTIQSDTMDPGQTRDTK